MSGETQAVTEKRLLVEAPEGQIWVCKVCGRYGTNRYNLGDTSCSTWAVLCYADSLEIENGIVLHAQPVKLVS